jgi:hypothetical protein
VTSNYGPFGQIVSVATGGIAAISAILVAWKRRASWEPTEEEVPTGGQKVSAVMALVALVYVYVSINRDNLSKFVTAEVSFGIALLISLLIYVFLISTCTYQGDASKKIVGGLWTTTFARNELANSAGETLQGLLRRSAFERDRIWSRAAQASAKVLFMLAYVGIIFCGTVAVTLAAQIVIATVTQPDDAHAALPVAPIDGTSAIAGLTRLHWNASHSPDTHSLRYLVQTDMNGKFSSITETRQSVTVRLEPGAFRWKIKAIWDDSGTPKSSPETSWQTVKVYANTLERIKDTKRIKIGQSEGYTRTNKAGPNGEPENFWTVWMPRVLHRAFKIEVTPEIVVAPWMDQAGRVSYLRLLDQDPSIDVLASGLTILSQRERDYGVKFSAPIGEYRTMLVTRASNSDDFAQIRLAAAAQTTNETYARQLAKLAPAKWKFDEPDASIAGPDVYTELLRALETDRVDAVIIDQPYIQALERDASIDLKFEYLQNAVKRRNASNQFVEIPAESIGVITRIEDESLRKILAKYAQESFTKNMWNNFYPGPP